MRKAREFLRKLSLNAEKNWHQNSGAKRRVVISDVDIDFWPVWTVGLRTSLIAGDTTRPWLWPGQGSAFWPQSKGPGRGARASLQLLVPINKKGRLDAALDRLIACR